MKKQIKNVFVHVVTYESNNSLTEQVNAFHVEIIQRRLKQSNLTADQKIDVVNRIIENLHSKKDTYISAPHTNSPGNNAQSAD